jgi:hypothetical protein
MIKRILAVGTLGSLGVLGLSALPAGAANIGPNVNLKDKAGVTKFTPKTLNLTLSKGKICSSKNFAFSITNKTSLVEMVDVNGAPFLALSPGAVSDVCVGVGTSTFTVEGASATLTVNMAPKK